MRHHTKDKGDIGLGHIIGDLVQVGIQVALPLSEHLPFDIIAISEHGELRRVQVKYRAANEGVIRTRLGGSWADRNGTHRRRFEPDDFDVLAIYCPEPRLCCYLLTGELPSDSVQLKVSPARNGQVRGVRVATDYTDPLRIFQRH